MSYICKIKLLPVFYGDIGEIAHVALRTSHLIDYANDVKSRALCRFRAVIRVLEHRALRYIRAETLRRLQIDVGMLLESPDLVSVDKELHKLHYPRPLKKRIGNVAARSRGYAHLNALVARLLQKLPNAVL